MNKPKISLIVAVSKNNVIGKEGRIPWHISGDLKRFKDKTTGHVIIMGRKTWDSFGHKPLLNRIHIVVTRDKSYKAKEAIVVHSLEEALEKAYELEKSEIFIIGGGELFKEAVTKADMLYLTLVHKNFDGDAFMPDYSVFNKKSFEEEHEENGYRYTFLDLEKE